MYCPDCGKKNTDGSQCCKSCGRSLAGCSLQPSDIGPKRSRLAITAFVLSILGLTDILALILGIVSLIRIDRSGGKITGRGFAILAIVITVIVYPLLIGSAVLVPALHRVIMQEKVIVCVANLRQWGLMYYMYCEDNDGRFFSFSEGDIGNWWIEPLRPYHKDFHQSLFLCPVAVKPYAEGGRNPFGAWKLDDHLGSYAPNGWICNPKPEQTRSLVRGLVENFWGTPRVACSGSVPLFLDSMWIEGWPSETDTAPPDEDWLGAEVNQMNMKYSQDQMRRFCVNRHSGYVNSLFMDSSVRKVGLKELWTLKWHRKYNIGGPWTIAGGVQPSEWPDWMGKYRDY